MSNFTIKVVASRFDCEKLSEVIRKLGFESTITGSRKDEVDALECSAVERYLTTGDKFMTASQIKEYLEEKSGQELNINFVGSALKKCDFFKVSVRVDKVPIKGYRIGFVLTREERFKAAQDMGFSKFGVKAVDFSDPDSFNKAVEAAKERL